MLYGRIRRQVSVQVRAGQHERQGTRRMLLSESRNGVGGATRVQRHHGYGVFAVPSLQDGGLRLRRQELPPSRGRVPVPVVA